MEAAEKLSQRLQEPVTFPTLGELSWRQAKTYCSDRTKQWPSGTQCAFCDRNGYKVTTNTNIKVDKKYITVPTCGCHVRKGKSYHVLDVPIQWSHSDVTMMVTDNDK